MCVPGRSDLDWQVWPGRRMLVSSAFGSVCVQDLLNCSSSGCRVLDLALSWDFVVSLKKHWRSVSDTAGTNRRFWSQVRAERLIRAG